MEKIIYIAKITSKKNYKRSKEEGKASHDITISLYEIKRGGGSYYIAQSKFNNLDVGSFIDEAKELLLQHRGEFQENLSEIDYELHLL